MGLILMKLHNRRQKVAGTRERRPREEQTPDPPPLPPPSGSRAIPGSRGVRDRTRERRFGGAGAQGWSHPGLDPWAQGSEDGASPAPGCMWFKGGLQLGRVQLQLVGWRAVPIGVRRGRIQRPVWLYHVALVLFQGQGL